ETDRVLHKTPFSFDVSVWEMFWPLMMGATVVLARAGGQQDSGYLAEVMARQAVTVAHFVPSMLRVFLPEPGVEQCVELRRVVCRGEALGEERQRQCWSRLNAELDNLYGPTEAAVDVTYWECRRGTPGIVPIGRPIANTQVYVLDAAGEPTPVGVTGEI